MSSTATGSRHPAQRITVSPALYLAPLEQQAAAGLAGQWLDFYNRTAANPPTRELRGETLSLVVARDGLAPAILNVTCGDDETREFTVLPLAHLRGDESGQDFVFFGLNTEAGWRLFAEPADMAGYDLAGFAADN